MSSEQQARPTPRRRLSPLAAASVAAAVLLVGGGGAYWASTAGDGGAGSPGEPGGPGGNPPPLALNGHTDAGSGGADSGGTSSGPTGSGPVGIAPGEPDPNGGGFGRVVYRAAGKLPDGPGSAPVYRAQGAVGADEVSRLAKALGVSGAPRLSGGSWLVGALPDGSGSQLRVSERAPGTWTFARAPQAKGSTDCVRGKRCVSGTPVDEAAAKKAAAPVLKALGLGDAKLDAGQVLGGARVVNADPVVGGLPTYGWTTGIPVGPDGSVVGGSGQLKGLNKGAEYPVVGAGKALELLNGAGRGVTPPKTTDCTGPVPVRETKGTDLAVEPVEPAPPRGKILPCEPRQVPQRTVTVGSAVFGLAAQYADGQRMLVPSWLFRVAPAGGEAPYTVTYPAVEPKFLVEPAPPKSDPTAGPSTDPTAGPGTTPDRHVESYRTDGRKLSLTFWGGVCSDYAAKAVEDGGSVKVRIVETHPDPKRICIALAKKLTESVTLEKPLEGRSVVGEDGKAVPKG
ncbi:hypothetical protein ACH4SP_16835 [Streptomyces sp. NPDC021093]|uniref:hypothetical protein n=1 Tax=Streptomyces sp. NPDC021093 TaxID=3365112 RepID=UPI0037AAE83B